MKAIRNLLRSLYHRLSSDSLQSHIKRGLIVGKNFHMQSGVVLDHSHIWHIEIGDDVTLAPRVMVLAHDASTKAHLNYARIGKVKIGDRVFVGAGSIILPGVTIGDNVIIGAGSIVSRDVPSGVVAVGNPAKTVCELADFLRRKRDELSVLPHFGDEYTLRRNISDEMKAEMNKQMKDGIGYVIWPDRETRIFRRMKLDTRKVADITGIDGECVSLPFVGTGNFVRVAP